jgi:arylsulfatase
LAVWVASSPLVLVAWGCEKSGSSPPPRDGLENLRVLSDGPRPDVLLVLIDTLRADRLGCYGHERNLTPAMDAIAQEAVTFDLAVAPSPWTQPSIAALFTAVYPGAIVPIGDYRLTFDSARRGAEAVRVLQDHHTTLAESMRDHGYATAAINTNIYIVKEYGFDQGFGHFDPHWPAGRVTDPTTGDVVNEFASKWLDQRDASKPFFLYLHYMDVHGPYNAGPKFLDPLLEIVDRMPKRHEMTDEELKQLDPRYLLRMPKTFTDPARHRRLWRSREYWEARYEAGVAEMDHHLADLRMRLEQMALWDDLVVVITADHGEALGEHGHFGHGFSIHHPELHIPLIVRSPGVLPAGRRVSEVVRLMDIGPTLFDHLGMPPMDRVQGQSLLPYIASRPPGEPLTALAEGLKTRTFEQSALYRGQWKMLRQLEPPIQLLHHIVRDPLERTDFAGQRPELLDKLVTLAISQQKENARLAGKGKRETVPVSAEQLQRLRSLGYVGDYGANNESSAEGD